ncbi:hypothetical protein PIB30_040551 [Stylosanthes scabra]|uniref:Uncharacterized protein n=1 Tax=Stylosanthes scabra TaxID=79078 RepID=A0ABU6VHH9_9FABA|nr:hypothetical protein [Stylosanthes scabra]
MELVCGIVIPRCSKKNDKWCQVGNEGGLEMRRVYEGSRGLELGLRQQRTIGSSKRLWGLCFHVGQKLTSRLTVAAGVPPAIVPATNLGFSR